MVANPKSQPRRDFTEQFITKVGLWGRNESVSLARLVGWMQSLVGDAVRTTCPALFDGTFDGEASFTYVIEPSARLIQIFNGMEEIGTRGVRKEVFSVLWQRALEVDEPGRWVAEQRINR